MIVPGVLSTRSARPLSSASGSYSSTTAPTIAETTDAAWDESIAVMQTGVFYGLRAAARHLGAPRVAPPRGHRASGGRPGAGGGGGAGGGCGGGGGRVRGRRAVDW